MASVEPKSGKLYKAREGIARIFGHGLLGPKWTEKWVHLDHHVLKYFSMASEQTPLFSLSSARQSFSIELAGYDFALVEDKRITRKHVFHLVPKNKAAKAYAFACMSEKELTEWQEAFQARSGSAISPSVSPAIAEMIRWASNAFTAGDMSEYSLIQQQLDPNVEGKVSRDQFLRVMKHYFSRQSRNNERQDVIPTKDEATTPRTSFSDQLRHTKHSEKSEPEVVSEMDPSEEPHRPNNPPQTDFTRALENVDPDQVTHARTWQFDFERLLSEPTDGNDPVPRGIEMATFISDFQRAAENAVETILQEIAAEEEVRTVTPLSLDDDQFFATDYSDAHENLRLGVSKFTIDGLIVYITYDEATHKVFGHHLRAARALHDALMATNATILRVPLQCVVDHRGFRALVIAPLSGEESAYRVLSSRMLMSCDRLSQQTIHDELKAAWKFLGIFVEDFGHSSSTNYDRLPQFVGAATGVSTAISAGRIVCYLNNLFDIFPVADEAPPRSLFRPELVSLLGETLPMYPQSCVSSFNGEQRVVLEQAVATADEHLRTALIPAFVESVEANSANLCDSLSLTQACHREGINARYLGLCFEVARSKHVKRLFVSEMIARACKRELRSSLQSVCRDAAGNIRRLSECGDKDARQTDASAMRALNPDINADESWILVCEFLKLTFSQGTSDSRQFWQERILPRFQDQFVFSKSTVCEELIASLPNDELVYLPQLFQAVQFHTRLSIFDQGEVRFPSPLPDLESVVMHADSIALCETTFTCKTFLDQTEQLISCGQVEEALERVKTRIAIVGVSLQGKSNRMLEDLLLRTADLSLSLQQVEQAERFTVVVLETSAQESVSRARAILLSMRVKIFQSEPLKDIDTLFLEGVAVVNYCFGCAHPLIYEYYTAMLEVSSCRGDRDTVDRMFTDLTALVKDCYGKNSAAYAHVRQQQGQALVNSARNEEALSVLDEAFSLYGRLAHEHASELTLVQELEIQSATCLYLIATLQAAQGPTSGLETAFSTAVRALTLREAILPAGHADITDSLLQLGGFCMTLGDFYRAQEYYRQALVRLRTLSVTEETLTQRRKVSQAVLEAYLQSLPDEKQAIVAKTKSRFADVMETIERALSAAEDVSDTSRELELIRQVTHELLAQDPVEYTDELINNAKTELQAQRRDRFASGTVRRDSAVDEPALPSRAAPQESAVSGSRFASFAIGQSVPPTPQPPLTAVPQDTSAPLLSPTGGFSHGAQLAALLFLATMID